MTNPTSITGNLAADVDLRFSQAGKAWVTFNVVLNKYEKRGAQGEIEQTAKNGMKVIAFGRLAENLAESIGKGTKVTVTGRLEPQQWQDKQSGQDRYGWELVAEDVAVSLARATAVITPNPREGQGGQPQGPAAVDPESGGFGAGGYDDPPF